MTPTTHWYALILPSKGAYSAEFPNANVVVVFCIELATMETRPRPCHPVLCHSVMYDLELDHGREYSDNCRI